MVDVQVRRLEAGDHEAVLALGRELALWFRPIDQIALAIDLRRHEGFIAERDGVLLGFLTYYVSAPAEAELSWLGVAPAAQGQGVGGALLAALESDLRARGVRQVSVSTIDASSDEPAFESTRRFYQHHGFAPAGHDRNYFGPGRDRLLLVKEIGADR